ncbi:GNAT family N-acetyltransferase [Motilimonas sp. 1_MG-2023]|uniref:GNAT family N-acetyltransferase n=1 Tax=Motilimonas TaxID=1914248 RepID=UPI0026E33744|nr:GNAT family N-acetyltransferase [Motilimonas sp. 1_MG-2023]MDO6526711.1 GNAT family N-acetyltransferase [Motilimonas sp. 1_MG-2023]
MIAVNGRFNIYNQVDKVDLARVKALLGLSYWAAQRSLEDIATSVQHSQCFSLYDQQYQIGFARIVTDYVSFAYLADVIIDPEYRGQGLGKWLVETVVSDPRWQGKLLMLATDDAHGLYQRHGFAESSKLMGMGIREQR